MILPGLLFTVSRMNLYGFPFTAICLALIFAPVHGAFMFNFVLTHNQYVSDYQCYVTHNVNSRLACGELCVSDRKCVAFYVRSIMTLTGNRAWVCGLGSEQEADNISFENGTYGYSQKYIFKNILPPPELNNGVLEYKARTQHGFAAVYNCSSAHAWMTNLAVLYKHDINRWPDISPSCAFTLCDQLGLSSSVLDITYNEPDNEYRAKVFCKNDEFHESDATCVRDGNWTLSPPLNVGCISTKCYRNNMAGKALYKGTKAVYENNITCQMWASKFPNLHLMSESMFSVDNYSHANAANYCRDPDSWSTPWCYQTWNSRWGVCDVPRCVLGWF